MKKGSVEKLGILKFLDRGAWPLSWACDADVNSYLKLFLFGKDPSQPIESSSTKKAINLVSNDTNREHKTTLGSTSEAGSLSSSSSDQDANFGAYLVHLKEISLVFEEDGLFL